MYDICGSGISLIRTQLSVFHSENFARGGGGGGKMGQFSLRGGGKTTNFKTA